MRFQAAHVSRLLAAFCLSAAMTLTARAADYGYDHVHLSAPDPVAAVAWYEKHIGGEKVEGQTDRLKFGTTLVIFQRGRADMKGTEGSSVDHIGFSFPDLAAKMKDFEAAEIKILQPARDLRGLKFGFIADPYGTKLEIMEDRDTLGFHHIHLRGKDPKGLLDWYQRVFGGERTQFKGMIDALKYGNVWLLAQSSGDTEPEPTQGRSLDHLGWMIPKLDEIAIEMKAKNVKFTTEPRDLGRGGIRIAFIEGPGGVRIELVQR